jgi:transcription elongation factor Elf1
MASTAQVIKCKECGLETKIDVELSNVQSLMVPQAEMKQKCKLATKPNFNFNCPHFNEAVRAATLPSGLSK